MWSLLFLAAASASAPVEAWRVWLTKAGTITLASYSEPGYRLGVTVRPRQGGAELEWRWSEVDTSGLEPTFGKPRLLAPKKTGLPRILTMSASGVELPAPKGAERFSVERKLTKGTVTCVGYGSSEGASCKKCYLELCFDAAEGLVAVKSDGLPIRDLFIRDGWLAGD